MNQTQAIKALRDALTELCDIVEGVVQDDEFGKLSGQMDSFTTQPGRSALALTADASEDAPDVRTAVERRIEDIWDDSCGEWGDAVGGPMVHHIFANRLISAVLDEIGSAARPAPVGAGRAPSAFVLDFAPEAPHGPAEEALTADEFALYSAMSDISEERWFAGWMSGNEYELWSALQDGEIGNYNRDTLAYIAAMSVKTGKWIVWHSDPDPAMSGPKAISLFDWLTIYDAKNDMRAAPAAPVADAGGAVWRRITAPGQVKVGDKLRFDIGDTHYSEKAKLILHAGTDKEEIIYNRRLNFYVITSMCMKNAGSSKNVEFLAASATHKGE